MTTAQLKMQDAWSLCNMIEIFCWRKIIKTETGEGFLVFSNFKWHWHNCAKTHSPTYVDMQMSMVIAVFFALSHIASNKTERGGPFGLFKLQMTFTQLCKNTFHYLCKHSNVNCDSSILCFEPHCKQQIFEWCKIEVLRQEQPLCSLHIIKYIFNILILISSTSAHNSKSLNPFF